MKNISFILNSILKTLKSGTLYIFLLITSLLILGQVAIAQNEPFRVKGKEVKEYLIEKYKLKKSQVTSEIQQTPNGPSGKLSLKGEIKPKNVVITEDTVQGRARAIAKAFLQEETDLFGITNMDEIREIEIQTLKAYGDYTNVYYRRYINDIELENAYIYITIGPDEIIKIAGAKMVPVSPELYEAIKKKTLSEAEIRRIVVKDLEVAAQFSETEAIAKLLIRYTDPKYMKLKKVAIPLSPYIVWKVISVWGYTINAFTGEILETYPA